MNYERQLQQVVECAVGRPSVRGSSDFDGGCMLD
jgi:hypothetical protein